MMGGVDDRIRHFNPRYPREPLKCYLCGGDCAEGYEERSETDSDCGYAETLFICRRCLEKERDDDERSA